MYESNTTIIILAAGKGTRMISAVPKVMHELAKQPILEYVLQLATSLKSNDIRVVVSPDLIKNQSFIKLQDQYQFTAIIQETRLGTANAVLCATIERATSKNILILYADTPFINIDTASKMLDKLQNASLVALGFNADKPDGYGRFIVDNANNLVAIVEDKELKEEQIKIRLCNAGIICCTQSILYSFYESYNNNNNNNNNTGEYYLTDIVKLAFNNNEKTDYLITEEHEVIGINDREQLAKAEGLMQNKLRGQLLSAGVTMIAPDTVFLTPSTRIASDVTIYPYVYFGPNVDIGSKTTILSFSHIEGAVIAENVTIGPFARIRPKSKIAANAKIGNFVEVKNANMATNTKAMHLSYIGDATIGQNSNIGAGTIFCNFDGKTKHHSELGEAVFIGSNSSIISPVKLGDGSLIAAGSVITKDVPKNSFAVARQRQVNLNKKQNP